MVDMAFIGWRNIRLINRIAQIYGIELGYYSRLKLFRLVLVNIAFAGATELVREVGMDWLFTRFGCSVIHACRSRHWRWIINCPIGN